MSSPHGPGKGWPAQDGGVWIPNNNMHGGAGWTVQYPDGHHEHVYPDGHRRVHKMIRVIAGSAIVIASGAAIFTICVDDSSIIGIVDDALLPAMLEVLRKGGELIAAQ